MDGQLGVNNHAFPCFAEQDDRFNDSDQQIRSLNDKDNEMSRPYIGSRITPMENHQEQNTWALSGFIAEMSTCQRGQAKKI